MAYTLTYRQRFTDTHPVTPGEWEILYNKKDGPIVDVVDLIGSGNPLTIEWMNNDQDKFFPIIGSNATIGYVYQGATGEPLPDEFINIEEDTWLIIINRNGDLYWKGFLKPDANNYPFIHPPFEFRMTATDYFQAMKSILVDLNDPILFLYDFITLGDAIKRTLFHAVEYDDAVLRVLCSIAPDAISDPAALFSELYIHTDAFYDFEKGPLPVYDCLKMICQAMGARIFYAAGSYWIQRVADLDQQQFIVYRLTPNDVSGLQETVVDVLRQLGTSAPQNDMYYLERTQGIYITPALKEQEFNFKLKAINVLENFDWRNFTGSQFQPGWSTAGAGLTLTRSGDGSIENPYKARLAGGGDPSIGQFIGPQNPRTVRSGQHIEINIKGYSYFTTGLRLNVALIPISPGAKSYYLDSGGEWKQDDVIPATYQEILYAPDKKTELWSGNTISKAIPGGQYEYTLIFNIVGPAPTNDPENPVPPGETIYNDIWPVFLRIFNNPYTDIRETIENDANYSLKPGAKEFFFLDTQDSNLSNSLFYNDGGTMRALPANNWRSSKDAGIPLRDLDAHLAWSYLDARQAAIYNIESDVFSNALEFHNVARCEDMPAKQFMMIRDRYDVRNCRHRLMIGEVKQEGTAEGTYEVEPITND